MDDDKIEKLERIARRLENSGLDEYVKLSRNTRKMLCLNFLSGVARGLGFTVGTALVLALAYKILSYFICLKIPYLTEMFEDFVIMIKNIR